MHKTGLSRNQNNVLCMHMPHFHSHSWTHLNISLHNPSRDRSSTHVCTYFSVPEWMSMCTNVAIYRASAVRYMCRSHIYRESLECLKDHQ